MRRQLIALQLLIMLGFLWGSGYVIARFCVTHGIAPLGYSFWQSLGPAVFLSLLLLLRRTPLLLSANHIRYYILSGLFGIALPNSIMYFAAEHLPAGLLAVLVNTVPLITYPLALLFAQERFSYLRLIAVILGVTGVMILVLPGAELGTHLFPWGMIVLLTPLSFAFVSIYVATFRPPTGDALVFSAGMLISSAIALLPLVLLTHSLVVLWQNWNLAKGLVLLEIIFSSLGYVLFFALIKRAGPVYYSLVSGVVSLTGLFWGWVIFHETLSLQQGVAIFIILLAIGLITLKGTQS